MKTKDLLRNSLALGVWLWLGNGDVFAQVSVTLDQAIEKALANNKLYHIKSLQVEEKKAKVQEDRVKAYPAFSVSSTYQYNANIGQLSIEEGVLGALPLPTGNIALPNKELNVDLGKHNTFNAGASVYQPVSQLSKIKTGVQVAMTDVDIAEREKVKVSLQIMQAVEKLYYGILINEKQKEEANAKLELARLKFYDLESAKLSGKTIDSNESGLQANIADEEQNLLKLDIQREDYMADMRRLTGIESGEIRLEQVGELPFETSSSVDDYKTVAGENNVDIQLAMLGRSKSELAIKAAKLTYRPDLGVFAGYTYQKGNIIFPQNNPFAGVSLKWNVQDLWSNKQVLRQRYLVSEQARQQLADKQEEVSINVEKAYRKIRQAQALIQVAERAVTYRQQEMKVQEDKKFAGLNTQADVLTTKSLLAKSEADFFAAQLSYRLAISDLKILTEKY
jgi:outer membrane protein